METFDVVVIGGGPGGYVAAVRASQLGFKTALVEKEQLGGTCLNWGCIPTKALLRNAELIHLLSKGRTFGFSFDNLAVDYGAAHQRSRSVVSRQVKRIELLMQKYRIAVYQGTGRLIGDHEVAVEPSGTILKGGRLVIATGAKPRALPGIPFDGKNVINFRHALDLKQTPASAVIIGAGPIGMEFATLWRRYGTQVTVVEMMPQVLPLEDEEISIEAARQFKRNGIAVKTNTRVEDIKTDDDGVHVTVNTGTGPEGLVAETVLVSIGFEANSKDLGLDGAGVNTRNGKVDIDDLMRTSISHIYAIGDVNGKMGLAHVASAQGIIAAESMAGKQPRRLNYAAIPRCTYAHPETASAGLTEAQAREQGYRVAISRSPFAANGKALAMDDNTGFVKVIADEQTGKLLGIHMIGGHVTELVAGPGSLLALDCGIEDYDKSIHPHPTLSEALMEAAHALCGHAIHI